MAYEHNNIATRSKLLSALGEGGSMGYEHDDIVTVDVMNEAIGGGGGGTHFSDAAVTFNISGDGTVVLSDIYFWAGGQLMYQDSMPLPKEASGETFYTLLVDGSAVVGCEPGEGVTSINVTTSGDATYYNDEITINGDCTIIVELGGK